MENKDLSAARLSVGALDLEEDPVVAAQARVDTLTGTLARLLDDDDATLNCYFAINWLVNAFRWHWPF